MSLREMVCTGQKIIFFGTGRIYSKYRDCVDEKDVLALFDNDPQKRGRVIDGKLIYSPLEGLSLFDYDKIYIMSKDIYAIEEQLKSYGVSEDKIDSYLSFDIKLGPPLLLDKENKIPLDEVRRLLSGRVAVFLAPPDALEIFRYLGCELLIIEDEEIPLSTDIIALHGMSMDPLRAVIYMKAKKQGIPIVFFEDGFLRSIFPCGYDAPLEAVLCRSIIFDGLGLYINANSESEMERILNSDFKLTSDEFARAEKIMKRIVGQKLSKYNNQTIDAVPIGRSNAKRVLVIDQVPGDRSITYGLASEETFKEMLIAAENENPGAEILIKCHPASGCSHYQSIKHINVTVMDDPINPYTLLEYVDKVYVCTSQMGFEALMAGCEVHVFGMPFYAGWGATHDRIVCKRRRKKRNVIEIFYVAYIMLTMYISTREKRICEIETVMDELISLREKYSK